METSRFDAVTRALAAARSRRGVALLAGGFLLGGPLALSDPPLTEGKKKKGKRKKKSPPSPLPPLLCVPEPRATTCAPGCGPRTNNCGETITCSCFSGQSCLPNGTCGNPCASDAQCAPTCVCRGTIEGGQYCVIPVDADQCDEIPVGCTNTSAVCPRGQQCRSVGCGQPVPVPTNRCAPLCAG